jgi:hypothetical protein
MTQLENQLQPVTTVSAEAFLKPIGESVTRRRFVLTLPLGEVSVAEACWTGVRKKT